MFNFVLLFHLFFIQYFFWRKNLGTNTKPGTGNRRKDIRSTVLGAGDKTNFRDFKSLCYTELKTVIFDIRTTTTTISSENS